MGYPISEQLLNVNRSHEHLSPIGFEIHSTDNQNDTAQSERTYYNSRYLGASVHYFAGTEIIRCIPENEVAGHAGPTANHKYLSVEMCEGEPFDEVWARTIWLVADTCVRYGWSTGPDVWSHRGTSDKWHETDHQDPISYLQRNGKTWEELLSAIDSEIIAISNPIQSSPVTILRSPDLVRAPAPIQSEPTLIFSFPNNAKVVGDSLYIRDTNGNPISGRYVSNSDNITVLDVSYSRQLVLVEYPTSSGVRSGYVSNKLINYFSAKWQNGSTKETVYDENGGVIGSLDPRETAILLYKKGNRYHVVYNTDKGINTKSGYVVFQGI